MSDFDAEAFAERAAIMEFDGGLSRWEAETQAAKAQGLTRWEAINHAKRIGNPAPARHHRAAVVGNGQGDMPAMQPATAQQGGHLPERDIQPGGGAVALLALRMVGGAAV